MRIFIIAYRHLDKKVLKLYFSLNKKYDSFL